MNCCGVLHVRAYVFMYLCALNLVLTSSIDYLFGFGEIFRDKLNLERIQSVVMHSMMAPSQSMIQDQYLFFMYFAYIAKH